MIDVRHELEKAKGLVKRLEALCDKWESATQKRDELVAGSWLPLSLTEKHVIKSFAAQVRSALVEGNVDDPTATR